MPNAPLDHHHHKEGAARDSGEWTPVKAMSITDKTTPTTEKTQTAATLPQLLPLDGTTLLGTVVSAEASRALIRLKSGKVQQLRLGDRIGDATIAAIEPGLIHMIRNGEAHRLAMP
ncbi:hypothetical protein K7H22_10205 [Seohaeicola saemankumensis]|nr:hypothetical protein [Seohaeicola saemankumensis]